MGALQTDAPAGAYWSRPLGFVPTLRGASRIVNAFQMTVPAVKSRLHRTRLLLRALLDERLRGKPPPDPPGSTG